MSRPILDEDHLHPAIRERISSLNEDILSEVQGAIANDRVVVIGMAQNPHVRRARKALTAKGVAHKYLEYGSYLSQWRRRNALKMWTGWPTFPMVFVDGVLIGGANQAERLLNSGELS